MNYVIWAALLILSTNAIAKDASLNSFTVEENRLQTALDATLIQMMEPNACKVLKGDLDFVKVVLDRMKAKKSMLSESVEASAGAAGLGALGLYIGAQISTNSAKGMRNVNAPLAQDLFKATALSELSLFLKKSATSLAVLGAVGSSAADSLSRSEKKKGDVNPSYLLNADRLEKTTAQVAKEAGELFGLSMAERATLKNAIKDEVIKKNNAKDLSSVDIFSVLKKASFIAKPILSDGQRSVLEKLATEKPGLIVIKQLTNLEKSHALHMANDALAECLAQRSNDDQRWNRIAQSRVDKNNLILKEIDEKIRLARSGSVPSGDPEGTSLYVN